MVFVRGQSQDYDTWAQLGNRGWSYREVLPIFRDMESFQGDADEDYRGRNGPLKVTESNESGAIYDALIKAAGQVGIAYTKDYNGAKQDGIGMTQATIRGGRRMSTAVCYLDPARTPAEPDHRRQRADRRPAVRRQALRRRALQRAWPAARSARHPRSGRQRRLDQLAAAAGALRHRPAGAAEGGRHRGAPRAQRRGREPARPLLAADEMDGAAGARHDLQRQDARPRPRRPGAAIRAQPHKGLLGLPAAPIRAYIRTRAGLEAPDAAISWIPFLVGENFQLAKTSGITAIMNILRSESTGSIHVASSRPDTPPAIRFNFLSAALDREVTLEAMRITRRIMTAPAMAGIATDEIAPGVNISADDELLDWVRNNAETTYHPVGTCKMGADPMAVVDDQLRVRGLAGLRVADASIMPTLTSGNTNAPSIMIGEKAARMMLASTAQAVAA